ADSDKGETLVRRGGDGGNTGDASRASNRSRNRPATKTSVDLYGDSFIINSLLQRNTVRTMRIGIDASNVRPGGGGSLTHLVQLLRAAEPRKFGISQVTVWGSRMTLQQLPRRDWLTLSYQSELDGALPIRMYWQKHRLQKLAEATCDLLF